MTSLQKAAESYRLAFGHGVPPSVAAMFASQPGPLLMEIRQALALQRPVPAWRTQAERPVDTVDRWGNGG